MRVLNSLCPVTAVGNALLVPCYTLAAQRRSPILLFLLLVRTRGWGQQGAAGVDSRFSFDEGKASRWEGEDFGKRTGKEQP